MHLKHLSLTNFRNFTRLDLEVPRRAILLVGNNAQGKTNLLEAVYFLATFTSFQTNADRRLVNFIAAREQLAVTRVVSDYQRGSSTHHMEVRLIIEPVGANGNRLRKEILVDGVKRPMNEVIGHFTSVIFVPQMSQIIEGGPDERRRSLNLALAQIIPSYARTLSEYNQAISQRNALLKTLNERGGDPGQLTFWDETLTRLGAQIILWRIQAVQEMERLAVRIHHQLTHGAEVLRLFYQPAYDPISRPKGQYSLPIATPLDRSNLDLETIRQGFLDHLGKIRAEEIARGVTTVGPHRDELRFLANGIDLGDYGSRGQVRTALLSLKLAEVEWMKERTGEWPVILLDEVMAELDLQRHRDLLKYLAVSEQVLLTTADLTMFTPEFIESAVRWDLQAGTVKVQMPG
ncbi:MAG: DNA replication/repair protein RecF [Anaerolineales bacterium]|nr:DNA replication/repair protein RecF [Anaerolineales bacterium]